MIIVWGVTSLVIGLLVGEKIGFALHRRQWNWMIQSVRNECQADIDIEKMNRKLAEARADTADTRVNYLFGILKAASNATEEYVYGPAGTPEITELNKVLKDALFRTGN